MFSEFDNMNENDIGKKNSFDFLGSDSNNHPLEDLSNNSYFQDDYFSFPNTSLLNQQENYNYQDQNSYENQQPLYDEYPVEENKGIQYNDFKFEQHEFSLQEDLQKEKIPSIIQSFFKNEGQVRDTLKLIELIYKKQLGLYPSNQININVLSCTCMYIIYCNEYGVYKNLEKICRKFHVSPQTVQLQLQSKPFTECHSIGENQIQYSQTATTSSTNQNQHSKTKKSNKSTTTKSHRKQNQKQARSITLHDILTKSNEIANNMNLDNNDKQYIEPAVNFIFSEKLFQSQSVQTIVGGVLYLVGYSGKSAQLLDYNTLSKQIKVTKPTLSKYISTNLKSRVTDFLAEQQEKKY